MTDPTTVALAGRMRHIRPFHVMELLRRAHELEAAGRSVVHMEIGEPDFPTAEPVVEAGVAALRAGHTRYLPAAGLPALREAIARHYAERYGAHVPPARILITPGASGALVVAMALLAGPGDNVLLPDPGYPCNRNFVRLVEAEARAVPVGAGEDYQLTAGLAERHGDSRTVAAMVGSPGNPTGTVLGGDELYRLGAFCRQQGWALIADEIYHGLHYDDAPPPTAATQAPDAFVVNSFSKYFGMTGWRLGWLVVPPGYESPAERLIQNLFISAPAPAQYAALACFGEAAAEVFEARRAAFRERRDFLLPALEDLGFAFPGRPAGAFYLYADISAIADDSDRLAHDLLETAGVATTPGLDFELAAPERHLRFAYTTDLDRLAEAVARIRGYLCAGG